MPNLYALAASPLGQATLQLAQEEGPKTKGPRAVFAVVLMFGILCGGVYMLLQSSFGPLQAYLVTSTAFWGSWLVLAVFWLVGVPGLSLGPIDIPRSTPQYYGPQGSESIWVALDTPDLQAAHRLPEEDLVTATGDITRQSFLEQVSAAETTAADKAAGQYAAELGVEAADVTTPGVFVKTDTKVVQQGGQVKWARVTFGPATPNATDSAETREVISRIRPKSVDLYFREGTLAMPTWYALGLFTVLFMGHAVGLAVYEVNQSPQPAGVPERAAVPV